MTTCREEARARTNGTPLFDDYEDRQEELYGLTNAEVYTRVLEDSGNREATIFGGLNTTVNWKNWRLNAAFSYSLGAKTRLFRLYQDVNGRIRPEDNLNRALLNRWQHPGDENHGMTLRQGRENYRKWGAVRPDFLRYVRPPRPEEIPRGQT